MQTSKSNFKVAMATVDPNFSLAEWDCLIPQANITLKLMRSARCNPKISAWSHIFSTFNVLATPLSPLGTKIVSHAHLDKRCYWELNGEPGWYVGPDLQHCRRLQ